MNALESDAFVRQRSWLQKIVFVAIPLFLMLLGSAWFVLRDAPPPNDEDLILEQRAIAPEDNGWNLFPLMDDERVYWPHESTVYADSDKRVDFDSEIADAMSSGSAWNAALAKEILERNASVLGILDDVLARKEFRFAGDWSSYPSYYFVQVIRLQIQSLIREDKASQAFDRASQLSRYGRRVRDAESGFLGFAVGDSYQTVALDAMLQMVSVPNPDRALTQIIKAAITEGRCRRSEAVKMIRSEYQIAGEMLRQLEEGESLFADVEVEEFGVETVGRWLFRPNATLTILGDYYRSVIEVLESPDLPLVDLPEFDEEQGSFFDPIGRLCLAGLPGDYIRESIQNATLRDRLTESYVALRLYELDHGELPEKLEKLVPTYLDEVPLDPFSRGQPLTYSKEKRVLYSIGKEGFDEGGPLAAYGLVEDGEGSEDESEIPETNPLRFLDASNPGILAEF